ncbi:recombinase [Vibrio cholerae]|nr:recombinase [Vibrio cholerae]
MDSLVLDDEEIPTVSRLKTHTSKEERAKAKAQSAFEKKLLQAQKQRERQIQKSNSAGALEKKRQQQESWNAFQYKTKKAAINRQAQAQLLPIPKSDNVTQKPASKGLKGRKPTVDEQRVMDAFGKLGCIACLMKGRLRPLVSIHHTDGRTKPNAHYRTLPLCENHHDTPAEKSVIDMYPDLIPIHAKGKVGGKKEWYKQNGSEAELLKACYKLAGITPPIPLE